VQLKNLETHPCVAAGLATGQLNLHGWVYAFETGTIYTFDPAQGKFVSIVKEIPGHAAVLIEGEKK
jgi:carbonic anhydrase